jgi:hypothetical protein
MFVVIKVLDIAQLSVCTDPNHSEREGAITASTLATKILSLYKSNQSKTCI